MVDSHIPVDGHDTDIIIVGAGPVGLFTVFEAGLLGLRCTLIDTLPVVGGQCAELYPEKPIYDIPGVADQTAQEHVDALMEQIKPFPHEIHLDQRVDTVDPVRRGGIDGWMVHTSAGQSMSAPSLFIAAGGGAFEPRKPSIPDIDDATEADGVYFAVKKPAALADQKIVIVGGGDSALDWTVALASVAKSVTLVHRRDQFRGSPHTESQMRDLVASGDVTLRTPYVPHGLIRLSPQSPITGLAVKNFQTSDIQEIDADGVLFLLGLSKSLGPIADWQLDLERSSITVDTEKFQTNQLGIFAVGDICTYPGKLNLILSGFHETTLAVQEAYRRSRPDAKRVPFRYTTTNPDLKRS